MVKRFVIALTAATALIVAAGAASPVGAQQYPPAGNFITVSDTTPTPGQTISITTGTYIAGSDVGVTFFSAPVDLGVAAAGANGVATLSAQIPSNAALGAHTITANGTTTAGPLSQSVSVTVVASGSGGAGAGAGTGTSATGALPRTGDDSSAPLARAAIVLVAAGGALRVPRPPSPGIDRGRPGLRSSAVMTPGNVGLAPPDEPRPVAVGWRCRPETSGSVDHAPSGTSRRGQTTSATHRSPWARASLASAVTIGRALASARATYSPS